MERIPLVHVTDGLRCFVDGPEAKRSLGARFFHCGDRVEAEWVANDVAEGWNGLLHGTAFAALHDEAAAWAMIALAGESGFTTRLDVRFLRPVRIGQKVVVRGRVREVGARSGTFETEMLLEGGVVASTALVEFTFLDPSVSERLLGRPLSPVLAGWLRLPRDERIRLVLEHGRSQANGKTSPA